MSVCMYSVSSTLFRGNHLSNTTCLTQVFFKRCERFGELWRSSTRGKTHKANQAAIDK